MPLHPAPPADLVSLVDAFEHTVQAMIDLGQTCSAADFDRPTECPGWSVKDQFSHVVGLETWFDGGHVPQITLPDLVHVSAGVGEFNEVWVHERRDIEGPDVVGELEDILPSRMTSLRDPALTPQTSMKGLTRPGPAGEVMRFRLVDVWCHEQDIRTALGRPGDLDSAGAAAFVAVVFSALPKIVARDAHVAPGQTVILDVTGPVVGRAGVRVVTDTEGRPRGEELFTGETPDAGGHDETGGTTSITLSTDALTRRAAGRRSVDDLTFSVAGDESVARRVLDHLVITP
ncbi:MAG: maleylpyruvate isomerase family mycothiol-dependent enzyme [Lapillicoccus sp.]